MMLALSYLNNEEAKAEIGKCSCCGAVGKIFDEFPRRGYS
jgi:hypothetical protein